MGRPRTGTLELRDGQHGRTWHTRVTVGATGETRRELYDLGTADEKLAKQKRKHLLKTLDKAAEQGEPPPARETLKREVRQAETLEAYSTRWVEKRKAAGVVMARDEENNLRRYVWPLIGDKPMVEGEIRSSHVVDVLDAAVAVGLGQETIRKIRAVMGRVFKAALREEGTRLKTNPVTNTDVPKIKGVRKKQRAIPTDEELAQYFACPTVDDEMKLMVLAARCEGGMRTSDVIRWDWVDVDTKNFAVCTIPRSKTGSPQELSIPPVLAAQLHRRWRDAGKPGTGPVFPVQRGPRKGEMRATRGNSFAKRFRRDLRRAGVLRKELYTATERTLPVDFHSLRRAFVTKLATSGVNVQTAMALAGHSDHRTHMLYVGADPALREIPAAVIPVVSFGSGTETPFLMLENARATQDSNLRPSAPEAALRGAFGPHFTRGNPRGITLLRHNDPAGAWIGSGTNGTAVLAPEAVRAELAHLTVSAAVLRATWDAAEAMVANDLLGEGGRS